nr:ricin-type beta-trefoil lectin domain protein [Streptomyces lonarensis]
MVALAALGLLATGAPTAGAAPGGEVERVEVTAPGAAVTVDLPGGFRLPWLPEGPWRIDVAWPEGGVTARGGTGPGSAPGAGPAAEASALPPELEEMRARQATELYGDAAAPAPADRQVSLVSLGDSAISGEGVGNYDPATDGPDNWCHRSYDAAIHRTGIPADVTYNFACSGAATANIRSDGTPRFDEPLQADSLAVAARNTAVDTVVLVVGANDDLEFGPVITDCALSWFLHWRGPCHPTYAPGWQQRVDELRPKVEETVTDLHAVMSDAGYARDDYRMVLMSYPGPLGPDRRDNPRHLGRLVGGCTFHDADARWVRDEAVPLFQESLRAAAKNADAAYLDASRLFHGHEVCSDAPWARGLTVDVTNPFPPDANSVRQSFHPNADGHGAFAACLTAMRATELREAGCADPASTGEPVLFEGAWDDVFRPLAAADGSRCLAPAAGRTANGTPVRGEDCDGARGQEWYHDVERGSLHAGLSHDRCLDVPGRAFRVGAGLQLHNCNGTEAQRFERAADGSLTPEAARELCVTLPAASGGGVTLQPCDGRATQRLV